MSRPQSLPDPATVGAHMYAADRASRGLGMKLVAIGAGTATMTMTVREEMLNGHDICHGGFITLLADSSFAFACNSRNQVTVASGLSVDFLAPAHAGDVLTAEAREVSLPRPDRRLRHGGHEPGGRARRPGPRPFGRAEGPGGPARRRGRSFEGAGMTTKHPLPGELEPIERASLDELRALQLSRLRWSLGHAYENVAHYRRAFDAAGVRPDDLKSLADLARFPFTVKGDLRDNYPFGMLAVPRERLARVHASSGTTGKPTVVGYTLKDIDTWSDLVARSIRAAGGRPGDMVHVAYGYGLFTGGLGAHYGAERAGCTVIPMSGGQTEKQVQLILDLEPQIIMITPSYMQVLIEQLVRQGVDPASTSLEVGIFGAEPWTEAMRKEIETNAGIDAVDIYGLSEVMGPGVASECVETKDGPVVWEDHFYPEIVDPETGAVLADGEEGELVFTTLTKEALPVIRYRTRDLTRLLPPTARSMRRMGKIVGRSDDMLIIRGVNLFPTQVEEIVLGHGRLSGQYQLVVTREGNLDAVEVRCEMLPAHAGDDRAAIADWLRHRIKSMIGITTTVDVGLPDTLERTLVGKARRVVDQRKK